MRAPLGWIRDYIDLDGISTEEIVEKLASLGFPVENVERRPPLGGIVAGRIVELAKHPNADRLQVCTIDVGGPTPLTIATAATNVARDQIVPVATVGASVASEQDGRVVPFTITLRKMRGVESQGMLCSAAELGLAADGFEDGILQLDRGLPLGTDAIAHYGLDQDVLDVEVTSNRADVLSMLGLAGELGAAYGKPVRSPLDNSSEVSPIPTLSSNDATRDDLRVRLESADCRRFVALRASDAPSGSAPAWMRIRLALVGQRPINALVDITNFVMLEIGQPLHAYDLDKLAGRCLIARDAREHETLRTLDDKNHALTPLDLVIADERAPQALAGLMGGAESETVATTREIALESASFVGTRIRRMGLRQGMRTDASSRHEKSLPLELADAGMTRAAMLLRSLGAAPREPFAVGLAIEPRPAITLPAAEIRRLLGIDIPRAEAERALIGLGFEVRVEGDGSALTYVVRPPARRNDIAIPADVVEEIARIVGYDRIEAVTPPILDHAIPSDEYQRETTLAHALAELGYREINTLALQPGETRERFQNLGLAVPHAVEIANPLSEDQRYLRFSLLPGLLETAARHRHDAPLRFFEIGHVFERNGDAPIETAMCAWLLLLPQHVEPAWRDGGFLEFKGDTTALLRRVTGREPDAVTTRLEGLHPGKTASLLVNGKDLATIGAVDPRLLRAYEIAGRAYCGLLRASDMPSYQIPAFAPPSRFPAIERDLALVMTAEIPAREIAHAIVAGSDGALRDVRVFDEYRDARIGEDRKSVTVRVKLQRDDATLTDEEADARIRAILESLRERVGAQLRS